MSIQIIRAYEISETETGYRILVDRIWPRGISKDVLKLDEWLKDIAPSTKLRRWFKHDPNKWGEFKKRYIKEIEHTEALGHLKDIARAKRVLLIYSAKDREHNQAVALKEYLELLLDSGK